MTNTEGAHMVDTIRRATEILTFVAETPRTISDMAHRFQVHRTTALRQIRPLEEAGFVTHRLDGTYVIGPQLISIAQISLDQIDLRRIAHDQLRELQRAVGNTVHLAQLLDDTVVYIDKVEGTEGVRMYSRIGKSVPAYCTGVGKAILSLLADDRRDDVLQGIRWEAHTPTTITDPAVLEEQLTTIAQRGWAVDNGEFENLTNCIAAPVRNSTGLIVGAISITAVRVINDLQALQAHLPRLLNTAAAINVQLG